MQLNHRAALHVEQALKDAERLRVAAHRVEDGGRFIDCGIAAHGGLAAGVFLARLTLADLGEVAIVPGTVDGQSCPHVVTSTDHPIAACMASQYAGWRVSVDGYFAMGSGPMRAVYGREELFESIGFRERAEEAVGALETREIPGPAIFAHIAEKCGTEPSAVTLAIAPTASLAGGIQVVARSVETALHKLHALEFDLERVVSGMGSAPLPPTAIDDLAALGRTNDSILYGAQVHLWVRGDDESLAEIGPRVPSRSSPDHGAPFGEIFARYEYDFYKIDAGLFSPAAIVLHNIDSGRTHAFGSRDEAVLARSFAT